jgi:voltage-gated potassium channel
MQTTTGETVADAPDTPDGPDERHVTNQARLAAWERRMNPVIIVAAILPIAVALTRRGESDPAVWLDLASWAVFVADFVVHLVLGRRYLRSKIGVFDLMIVVLTAPWYLIPGLGGARVAGIARLGRLARVLLVSSKNSMVRDLGGRMGRAALYSVALMATCAVIVRAAEPAESGFESFGVAMWWSIVTFTTVGYGDLYPETGTGRLAAVLLMVGGVALIGTLAGSLGSFFSAKDDLEHAGQAAEDAAAVAAVAAVQRADDQASTALVLEEIAALRAEIAALRDTISPAGGPRDP